MRDLFLYVQFFIFMMNIFVFIFIMETNKYDYKGIRAFVLVILSIGMLSNIGKLTIINVLFSFSTFLSLLKIKPDGNIHRIIEKCRHYFGSSKQPHKKLQGSHKTVAHKEA